MTAQDLRFLGAALTVGMIPAALRSAADQWDPSRQGDTSDRLEAVQRILDRVRPMKELVTAAAESMLATIEMPGDTRRITMTTENGTIDAKVIRRTYRWQACQK